VAVRPLFQAYYTVLYRSNTHRTPLRVLRLPLLIMSSRKPTIAVVKPSTSIPLSTDFCADDADVVIRAAGALDFRAHKIILSLISPVFRDMFTLPQPPSDAPSTLPTVDVHDSPKAWENILRTIYPTQPNPTIDTLDDLESLIFAAKVYEMRSVIEAHKKVLEHREFVEKDPLRLYAIACACGFEDQATYVARNAELVTVTRRSDPSDLKGLTFGPYCRLVSFLVDRDNDWHQALGAAATPDRCNCDLQSASYLYNDIKKHLRRSYLQTEEVYLKALEDRSRRGKSGCLSAECSFGNLKIKTFIRARISERDGVCNKLQPAKWYLNARSDFANTPIHFVLIRFA
jgi:hypothetical protein